MTKQSTVFDPKTFLSAVGAGKEMMSFRKGQRIFAEGDASDAVFVVQTGSVRLSARCQGGKEATLDILSSGDFVGKDSLAGEPIRTASANALTCCQLLRIEQKAMMLALAQEVTLATAFCAHVLKRNIRYQQDLVDQRCNPSEKRLARVLLRLTRFDGQSSRETAIPKINQETLAEMVGTTRSRVCFFMNKFRNSGLIEYDPTSNLIRVHCTLLTFCAR
jgi:CRP/FNR family transcriptional regulator, cyclic AMP receptor protein